MTSTDPELGAAVESLYRSESRRVIATLIRLLGDFDLAEEAMQEAFSAALTSWKASIPANPRAWLISTGRFKAIDQLRRRARFDAVAPMVAAHDEITREDEIDSPIADDRLRLIFTCCHPALSPEARTALTLREVCGLSTEAIAHAFLIPAPTLAQRIVRAKNKIRDAGIPYEIPDADQFGERLESVLAVIYLVFNEGYSSSSGTTVTTAPLADEAIRLGRLLAALLPTSETTGLLALMLLHHARSDARTDEAGELVLLQDQDRRRWNGALIAEGSALVETALRLGDAGPYAIQAAIAALHSGARTAADTDWREIAGFYDLLAALQPSSVVFLNRAVAIAMRDGPAAGLAIIDQLLGQGHLTDYHLAHAARAELCHRLDRNGDARASYRAALALVQQAPERRLLEQRLAALPE